MSRKTRLELTWIGKENRPKLEPRILIEEQPESHHAATRRDGDHFDNMLIHGDNLLALKALEADFSLKVRCAYIDPPFNTQQDFENYPDGLEHSSWLQMMRERVESIHRLLREDGSLFVHIDDNELGYIIPVVDEIFGRKNRIAIITFKQSSISGPKAVNPGLVTTANYILYYCKNRGSWNPNRVYAARKRDARYNRFVENRSAHFTQWRLIGLGDAFDKYGPKRREKEGSEPTERAIESFVLKNADAVTRLARVDPSDVNPDSRKALEASRHEPNAVFCAPREGREDVYFMNGEQLIFYSAKARMIDGVMVTAETLSNIWDDLLSNNVHKEGQVRFPNGKKPEALLKRIFELESEQGDLVLDSFAGSGTTGAVAHKMRRRWIMVEQGDHCSTHVRPRLKRVVDGDDLDGVSRVVGWQGGGGFRSYRLAPSLLTKDRYGNWVISKEYNAAMLAEAVCKLMGFTYAPSQSDAEYWRHGHSTETDFIYVTTQSLTHDALKKLSDEVGPNRTLLVCCKAFNTRDGAFDNLTIRKIPLTVLSKCEWGRDDYSLAVADLPATVESGKAASIVAPSVSPSAPRRRSKKKTEVSPSLFDDGEA